MPSSERIEDWAVCMDARLLLADGHEVRIAAWPDRERNGKPQAAAIRTPDCLIEIDGILSAVEVTEFWTSPDGGRQEAEWQQFQDRIRGDVIAEIQHLDAAIFCQAVFRQLPPRRQRAAFAASFVQAFRTILPELLQTGSAHLIRRYPASEASPSAPDDLRARFATLEFRLMPGVPRNVVLAWSDSTQTFESGPEYEQFVDELLTDKAKQLQSHAHARICVAGHPPFLPRLLQRALSDRERDIPPNWDAVTCGVIGGPPVRVWPSFALEDRQRT